MDEGAYHEAAQAHWMNVDRLWLPWGQPKDQRRLDRMRALFDKTPLDELMPLVVVRMIGAPYANRYVVFDGHHRTATAQQREIDMLLVRVWRDRGTRFDQLLSTSRMIFDRV